MPLVFRRLLAVLVAFALVGGTTAQFAQAAQYVAPMTMAGMPCGIMMPMAAGEHGMAMEHGMPMMPGKGMAPDCTKQMCCMVAAALPARFVGNEIITHYSAVDYWPARSRLAGVMREPEPLPPRTT
jgi:hypothetical protein